MPRITQQKMLDVLEDKRVTRLGASKAVEVDVRIITGTNQPLREMVDNEQFRRDLYHRINILDIRMPALRDRHEDIPLLCESFVRKFAPIYSSRVKSVSRQVLELLRRHMWPGNVRELRNLIEKAMVKASGRDAIDLDNKAIIEIAKNLTTATSDSDGRAAADDLSEQIWNEIKEGRVVKNLTQWAREIGKPKTLKLIELSSES